MQKFWLNWLIVVTVLVMLFGLSMVLLPDAIQALFNWIIYQDSGIEARFGAEAVHYIRFVYGVLGAVMFGWMIPLLFILWTGFREGKTWAWLAISLSLGLWFIVDTSWSAYMGFWGNVALNVGTFILYLIPLAATARSFLR